MSRNSRQRGVAALDVRIARLMGRQLGGGAGMAWWEIVAGCFAGDRAFDEATRLGRAYRRSLRPKRAATRKRR